MNLAKTLAACLLAAVTLAVQAAPAPWYLWRSLVENMTVCAQTPPGEGWDQIKGPYQDAQCRTPGKPSNAW